MKKWSTNDYMVYLAATIFNLIVYAASYIINKNLANPLIWVLFILFPTLIFLAAYEKYKHLFSYLC